jgi:psiF repeat
MRDYRLRNFSIVAVAICAALSALVAGADSAQPAPRADATAGIVGLPTPAPAASGDAAAKHAKRTACLKEAKTKKLVGADKTSFLKSCIAAP